MKRRENTNVTLLLFTPVYYGALFYNHDLFIPIIRNTAIVEMRKLDSHACFTHEYYPNYAHKEKINTLHYPTINQEKML